MANTVIGAVEGTGANSSIRRPTTVEGIRKELNAQLVEKQEEAAYKIRLKWIKKGVKDQQELDRKVAEETAKVLEALNRKTLKQRLADFKKEQEEELLLATTYSEKFQANFKKNMASMAEGLGKSLGGALNSSFKSVDDYTKIYSSYMSSINTRLQGSSRDFASMSDMIRNNVGSSQFVKQTAVFENLSRLVAQGISYNVEQRAFLASISDKIATTFNAANGTLIQLIRIQQADSTAARLGMEASLTSFLNRTFQDTSYLSGGARGSVSSSLMGTSSLLGKNQAVEFEYAVEKWLGSLGAVGVGDSTLSSLAQGLGYLGTGDLSSLSSNQALSSLFALAANRAGLPFGSLFGNLSADSANKLLSGVVQYVQEIASNSNNVVKSQYAQLFGMTISDMTAMLNLSSQDLVNISSNMLTYSDTLSELDRQLESIPNRMHLSERIDNLVANTLATVGGGIAGSAGMYTTWMINNLVEQATGGVPIPSVFTLGTGIDLNTNLNQLVKVGLVGTSLMSQIGSIMSGLSSSGGLSLSDWGASEFTGRGTGFTGVQRGVSSGTSTSAFIGNSDYSDIYSESVAGATTEAESSKVTGAKDVIDYSRSIYDLLIDLISGGIHSVPVKIVNVGETVW